MSTIKPRSKYLQAYITWAKAIFAEGGSGSCSQTDLRDALKLAQLLDMLWPKAELSKKLVMPDVVTLPAEQRMNIVLEFFRSAGIQHSIIAADVLDITKPALAELLWLIILNYCIHSPTLNPFLRNVKVGERMVLNWCRLILPNMYINLNESLVQNICHECGLIDVIERFCKVQHNQDTVTRLKSCLQSAQTELAVPSELIDCTKIMDKSIDGEVLLIYLSLLRRKVLRKQSLSRSLTMSSRHALMPPPNAVATTALSRQSSSPL